MQPAFTKQQALFSIINFQIKHSIIEILEKVRDFDAVATIEKLDCNTRAGHWKMQILDSIRLLMPGFILSYKIH